ncbi:hypothetical protein FRC15_001437 [Serendipita sp. 397]|nr:hypothetical protein FRC15_001437 [Serendipita sp. 397]
MQGEARFYDLTTIFKSLDAMHMAGIKWVPTLGPSVSDLDKPIPEASEELSY